MIFRLLNYTVMGIAVFYLVEGTGLIEKRKYFPTLPRLEATASDPMAWLGAAKWGFSQMGQLATGNTGDSFDTGSLPHLNTETLRSFTRTIESQRRATSQYLGY